MPLAVRSTAEPEPHPQRIPGPYVASKAADDALAETMLGENRRYGIDTVIIQPGAYTAETNHFAGAQMAEDEAGSQQYHRINDLPPKLAAQPAL